MNIKLIPSDMDAPGFYRLLSPARQLAMAGHQVSLPPSRRFKLEDGNIRTEFKIDVESADSDIWVLQQRRERMWATGAVHRLREQGVVTIADVDDNYLELPEWNPGFYGTHPHIRDDGVIVNRSERRRMPKHMQKVTNKNNRNWMLEVFKQVDAMTVSTPYLKQLYSKFCDDITVIRNYVDWDMWADIVPVYEGDGWDRLRIGYLGAFNYRRGDLSVIKGAIRPFMLKHPEIDFVANTDAVHEYLGIPDEQRVTIGEWTFFPEKEEMYPLPQMTAVMDIGLVPLAPGGMAEGKSHLKGMEYNAAGIPFLCSNTESYRYWTDELSNGVTCHTASDWVKNLEILVADHATRKSMGKFGREKAERHSIQNNWHEYEAVYDRVLGDELTRVARGSIVRGAVQKVSELRSLLELASDTELKTVVEVGSARGGTFWALSQIAHEEALLVSVDIPSGSPLDVREGKDVYTGRDRERFRTFVKEGQRCVLIDGDSQALSTLEKLVDTIGTTKIDLLFIDADHRYQGVKRDYELYSPLVRPGGLIVFHDVIRQNDHRSGVHLLWNMLKEQNPDNHYEWVGKDDWGLGNWGGIGVIVKEASLVNA